MATTTTTFIGLTVSAILVFKRFKTLIDWPSVLKILGASLVIYVVASQWPTFSGFLLLVEYGSLTLLYGSLLYLVKELRREDLERLRMGYT